MLLRPRQKQFVERSLTALEQHGNTLGVAPTGCHAPGTPILMFDGSLRAVEDVAVGDLLMGPDSTPREVLELHRGRDAMVEVRPMKGASFRVNLDHVLTLVRTNDRDRGGRCRDGDLIDITVREWLAGSSTFRHMHKLLRRPADFPARPAPAIDPWLLGVLIGDGTLGHGVSVTTPDAEIADALHAAVGDWGLTVRVEQIQGNEANTYHLVGCKGVANPLTEALRALGLAGRGAAAKFIPDCCRLGSRDVRLAVLAGLLDTDGHLCRGAGFEFSSSSRQLAGDLAFVARSLGLLATIAEKEVAGELYWRVHISGDCERIPTRVVRKQSLPRRQKKNQLRTGFTVHPVGEGDYVGFAVNGDRRYLMGDFTVTHNSGKTIMLSAVTGELMGDGAKTCVLAHRDELTSQNRDKFSRVNPDVPTSVVDARGKDWSGAATFAMVQTLSRPTNLAAMPALDLLVIDEAHHAAADSYRRIIDRALDRNPACRIYGVTATPNRGDKRGLRPVFSNVADQIRIGELVRAGHLVAPRTFVLDVGVQDALRQVRRTVDDFDMSEVARIMDHSPVTEAVIRHWQEKAGDRQTVVFCSTVEHATNVAAAFNAADIPTVLVTGAMPDGERRNALAAFASGEARVVVNVAVLTEGWDHPPTSCVVLLRPSSYKSTMIQMVGRGLRTVNPNEHPGVIKTDCIVLDFGTSSLIHGSLEQDVDLDGHEADGQAPTKECPECAATVPTGTRECPLCGYVWERQDNRDASPLADFIMSEIDLLKRSSFKWVDLFGDDAALVANGFDAWGGVFFLNGRWYGLGGVQRSMPMLLAVGDRTVCMAAADDWLNEHETDESAHKSRRWLNEAATDKQMRLLPPALRNDYGLTRYQASALITFRFNRPAIQKLVFEAAETGAEVGRAA